MYHQDLHRKWVLDRGFNYVGAFKPSHTPEAIGCFVCKTRLPLKDDYVCEGCYGISCGNCGACNCGRERYRHDRQAALKAALSELDDGHG